jgi:hypothetical protein
MRKSFNPFFNLIPTQPPEVHSQPQSNPDPFRNSTLRPAFRIVPEQGNSSVVARGSSVASTLPRKRRISFSSANPAIRPRAKKRRVAENAGASKAVRLAVGLLEEEFKLQETASREFPTEISSSHIRSSICRYEDEILASSERSICCSCGGFFPSGDTHEISDQDERLQGMRLDRCGYHENSWYFCRLCHTAIGQWRAPKFSALNSVNVTMCQEYPAALEDLTPVEECLIAKCHPVGTILKLRPGGHVSPTNYSAVRGHMIVIPQEPGPLLQILPSPELKLENLIKVFWLGKTPPTNRDLKPFLQVRKDKVLAALRYLVQHNHLYHDLTINYGTIDGWTDDFIPPEIADNVTCLADQDHHEREGYTVSLQSGNHENDLHAAQDEAFQTNDHDPFVTGSVYTDINGERTDPNVRMIDALLGITANDSSGGSQETQTAGDITGQHRQGNTPMISYAIRGQATLMSNWEDPHYFTGAFPTLFPSGLGGHLDKRQMAVSLEAFAQWTLNHHSRR